MIDDNPLWAALTHPYTAVSGLLATLSHFANVPVLSALFDTAWAHAGMLFAGVSLSADELGDLMGLSSTTVHAALAVAGALWLAKIIDTLWDAFQRRLERRSDNA